MFGVDKHAIKISTLNVVVYLGIANETGSIEVGKIADMVLIDGDLEKKFRISGKWKSYLKMASVLIQKKYSVKGKLGLD